MTAPPPHKPRTSVTLVVSIGVIATIGMILTLIGLLRPGDSTPTALSTEAGRYDITFIVDRPAVGTRDAEVIVTDSAGSAVADAAVVISATMQQMGHAGEVTPGRPSGNGRYRFTGNLFPMPGGWIVQVVVERDGETSVATLPIAITAS